jgi:hypothetical protein
MKTRRLALSVLDGRFAVCRLDAETELPRWATRGEFFSVTRTPDELSVVCAQRDVPAGVVREEGWACLEVDGPFDFSACGVLASLATPLAEAGIPVLAIATHDTDYLLVKYAGLDDVVAALVRAGHRVSRMSGDSRDEG